MTRTSPDWLLDIRLRDVERVWRRADEAEKSVVVGAFFEA